MRVDHLELVMHYIVAKYTWANNLHLTSVIDSINGMSVVSATSKPSNIKKYSYVYY